VEAVVFAAVVCGCILTGFYGYVIGYGAGARAALEAEPEEQRDTLPSLDTSLPAMDFGDLPDVDFVVEEDSAAKVLSEPPKGAA
jgi:hypothetical protein